MFKKIGAICFLLTVILVFNSGVVQAATTITENIVQKWIVTAPPSGWLALAYNTMHVSATQDTAVRLQGVTSAVFINENGSGSYTLDQWHFGLNGTVVAKTPPSGSYSIKGGVAGVYGDAVTEPGANLNIAAGVLGRKIGGGGGHIGIGAGLYSEYQDDPNTDKIYGIYAEGGRDGGLYIAKDGAYINGNVTINGNIQANNIGDYNTINTYDDSFSINTIGSDRGLRIISTQDSAVGSLFYTYHDSTTPAKNDILLDFSVRGNNSVGVTKQYFAIFPKITNPTSGAESAYMEIHMLSNGHDSIVMTLTDSGQLIINGDISANGVNLNTQIQKLQDRIAALEAK